MKIKEKIIHWLGGFTENEYNNTQAISLQALPIKEEKSTPIYLTKVIE